MASPISPQNPGIAVSFPAGGIGARIEPTSWRKCVKSCARFEFLMVFIELAFISYILLNGCMAMYNDCFEAATNDLINYEFGRNSTAQEIEAAFHGDQRIIWVFFILQSMIHLVLLWGTKQLYEACDATLASEDAITKLDTWKMFTVTYIVLLILSMVIASTIWLDKALIIVIRGLFFWIAYQFGKELESTLPRRVPVEIFSHLPFNPYAAALK